MTASQLFIGLVLYFLFLINIIYLLLRKKVRKQDLSIRKRIEKENSETLKFKVIAGYILNSFPDFFKKYHKEFINYLKIKYIDDSKHK